MARPLVGSRVNHLGHVADMPRTGVVFIVVRSGSIFAAAPYHDQGKQAVNGAGYWQPPRAGPSLDAKAARHHRPYVLEKDRDP
jgi:hypothetical protein